MLYGNQSISEYTPSNIVVWMSMAFQAGVLNIGGFLACHRFVSHVTGFATFFGVEVSKNPDNAFHAIGMLVVPLFFLLGAMLSGLLVDLRLKLGKKPRYYFTFGIIFLLTVVVLLGGLTGKFGNFGEPLALRRNYALLVLLCLICGIQNGTITSVSRSVLRTTHLTGITTDLGIGIIRFLNRHQLGDAAGEAKRANLMRIGIIAFFGLGSVAGGYTFSNFGYAGFVFPVITSGLLFTTMMYYQVWKPRLSTR
ncbi:YoaK family protein [soil metagenome]